MKKVCVITGSRAEYGLLRNLMKLFDESDAFELHIVVTGMHLSAEFGLTINEIQSDEFIVSRQVECLLSSDSAVGVTKSMGLAMMGISEVLSDIKPDMVVLLGDRFEIFASAAACLIATIPIAHLHGGEITEGAYDDAMRHSITKMSRYHFVAAEEYRNRVIQLGEEPSRVFTVGGLGIDGIKSFDLISRSALEADLDFCFQERNLLVTFHPATLDKTSPAEQLEELLAALRQMSDLGLLFTMPNADSHGRELISMINQFVTDQQYAKAFKSLGQIRYLSCLACVDGVIGNSSSGLIEAPAFKIGTINIGNRQNGRLKASSVIDCDVTESNIIKAIHKLYSNEFQQNLPKTVNPYGDGGASEKIFEILKTINTEDSAIKHFHDISF